MHRCKALVLTCTDFRFQEAIADHLEHRKLQGNYDRVGISTGCLALSRPSDAPGKDLILQEIALSQELHGIRQVMLINHQDCEAYGTFDDEQSERVQHEADLKKAASVIERSFSGVTTECYFATIEEKGTQRTIRFARVR